MCILLYVYGNLCVSLVGLTHVGIESAKLKDCSQLLMVYINIENPHSQHLHEVIIDKNQG